MADKNETFVLARRRKDGVEMILGRKLIAKDPHIFEEIGCTATKTKVIVVPEDTVPEDADISMDFNTADFENYKGKALTNVDEYREALDDMGVEYKMTHGMPGLKKLFNGE